MRLFANLPKMVAITGLLVTAVVGGPATASDFLDVSGMKAIYDAATGSLRFEGLFNIHGVGIGRNDKASFHPEGAATTQASFAVANEEEAGWLFLDGIEGGSFDAGAIFPSGLSDGLSDFYIGVSSIGSGKNVTPIPIYTPSGAYLPNFDLYAPPSMVETPPVVVPVAPAIPIEPVIVPLEPVIPSEPVAPPNEFLDVSGMKAIYDADTGNLRFEGLFNIHGVGIGRNDKVEFRPEGATTTEASFAVTNEEEAGWLFFDGIEGGSFDAGTIFPTGLSDGLSDFYVGVSSIGSGKNVTPIPIYTSSGVYLPNFDLFAPPPIVETPPILDPVAPEVPMEPVIPSEPAAPPVVELPPVFDPPVITIEEPAPPIDSVPIIIEISDGLVPGITTWDPVLGDYMTFQPIWNLTLPYLDLGWRVLQDVDLVDVSLNGLVDFSDLNADSGQFTSLTLHRGSSSLVFQLMGAPTLAGISAPQVAVPEPAAGVMLLSAVVGLRTMRRRWAGRCAKLSVTRVLRRPRHTVLESEL